MWSHICNSEARRREILSQASLAAAAARIPCREVHWTDSKQNRTHFKRHNNGEKTSQPMDGCERRVSYENATDVLVSCRLESFGLYFL